MAGKRCGHLRVHSQAFEEGASRRRYDRWPDRQHQIARRNLLTQAAHRAAGDDAGHTQFLEREDVRPVGHAGRIQEMAFAVTGQQATATPPTWVVRMGLRTAEGRVDVMCLALAYRAERIAKSRPPMMPIMRTSVGVFVESPSLHRPALHASGSLRAKQSTVAWPHEDSRCASRHSGIGRAMPADAVFRVVPSTSRTCWRIPFGATDAGIEVHGAALGRATAGRGKATAGRPTRLVRDLARHLEGHIHVQFCSGTRRHLQFDDCVVGDQTLVISMGAGVLTSMTELDCAFSPRHSWRSRWSFQSSWKSPWSSAPP